MPVNIFTTVEDPLATQDTQGGGINNAGQIVGDYADASGGHGFLLSGGVFTTIDEPVAVAAGNVTSAKAVLTAAGFHLSKPASRIPLSRKRSRTR